VLRDKHISSLSDARGSKNMHSTVMRKPFDKKVQAVCIIHVKDLVLNLPEFCDVFLQSRYAVKLHTKKHLALVVRRCSIFLKLLNECMSDLAIHQGEAAVEPHGVVVETACFAGKETEQDIAFDILIGNPIRIEVTIQLMKLKLSVLAGFTRIFRRPFGEPCSHRSSIISVPPSSTWWARATYSSTWHVFTDHLALKRNASDRPQRGLSCRMMELVFQQGVVESYRQWRKGEKDELEPMYRAYWGRTACTGVPW